MSDDLPVPGRRGGARVVPLPGLRDPDRTLRVGSGSSGRDEGDHRRGPAAQARDPHEAAALGQHWCYGCEAPENPDGAYRVCAECGHVFPDEAELIRQDHDAQLSGCALFNGDLLAAGLEPGRPVPRTSGDEVWVCPVCCHDF
jgi:hypothetical protein